MFFDLVALTIKGLRYRPIRSWLTILGVVIGIMLVVVIMVLGSGVQNAITNMLQSFGSDLILIYPGEETDPFTSLMGGVKFKEQDITNLAKIDGVEYVVPFDVGSLNIEYKGEVKAILAHASTWRGMREIFENSGGRKLAGGRWPTDDGVNEVVVGYRAFNDLFKNKMHIGDEIVVKAKRLKVVGYLAETGDRGDDNSIYFSLPVYRQITGTRTGIATAIARASKGHNVEVIVQKMKLQLSQQDTVTDFSVLTMAKANKIVGKILATIELVFIVFALISLIVGAVGIMNTMYTSVLERTKQIGTMKAVGASSEMILSLFLIESGIIGLIGGVLGVSLGILLAFLSGLAAEANGVSGVFSFASIDILGILSVLVITFIVGILSGVMPARQASRMEPADALRY